MKAHWKAILALSIFAVLVSLLAYRVLFYASPVAVLQVKDGKVALDVRGPGVVTSRIAVTVSTRVTGILKEVRVDQGDYVKAGQLLALLDDTDAAAKVNSATAAAAKAQAELELAQSNYRRDQEMVRSGHISRAAMDVTAATLAVRQAESHAAAQEAAYASALLSFTRISAPGDGLIIARDAEVGDTVVPGSPVFRMVDPLTLWVAARIDETVVGQVEVGQPATIRLRSGKEAPGEVARINLQSDAATRELEVDVVFRDIPERFAIDQEAEVIIRTGEERGVVIPASALFQQGREFGVLVVTDGRAVFRPVQTGASDGERAIARVGLEADEAVIRRPADIRAGDRVRPVTGGER